MKNIRRAKEFGKNFTWKIWVIITIIILKKDVLLLANIFKKFIDTCLKFYRLDPCHYYNSPGLTWDAMLKISDIDMYLFIEKGMRRGISYIVKRYAKGNNKYIKNYDPKKPSYLDMNNLYGWVMSRYLPYGGFKWLKNVDAFDVSSISDNRIFSQSWSWISWWITCIAQQLSISSRKTCNSLWHAVRLL